MINQPWFNETCRMQMAETAVPQNFQSEKLLDKGGKFIRGCILRWEIKLFFCLKNFPTRKKYYNISTIWFPQLVIEVSFKVCTNNEEIHKWCSPPLLNWRDNSGDMLLLAALLASGNNFQKNVLFAKFLKFPIMSSSLFVYIQRTYTTPSIEEISTNYQKWNFQSI